MKITQYLFILSVLVVMMLGVLGPITTSAVAVFVAMLVAMYRRQRGTQEVA
jgi:hypothetical protein